MRTKRDGEQEGKIKAVSRDTPKCLSAHWFLERQKLTAARQSSRNWRISAAPAVSPASIPESGALGLRGLIHER